MNRDEIIRMVREAGWSGIYTQWREPDGSPDWTPVKESLTVPVTMEQIERFAALVAAHEREACANLLLNVDLSPMDADHRLQSWTATVLLNFSDAIRARGEQ